MGDTFDLRSLVTLVGTNTETRKQKVRRKQIKRDWNEMPRCLQDKIEGALRDLRIFNGGNSKPSVGYLFLKYGGAGLIGIGIGAFFSGPEGAAAGGMGAVAGLGFNDYLTLRGIKKNYNYEAQKCINDFKSKYGAPLPPGYQTYLDQYILQ